MKIYTKTGDKGKTSLYKGKRCNKDNPRVEAYGTIDELNSAIGVAIAEIGNRELEIGKKAIHEVLREIQSDLFKIGAILAGDNKKQELRIKDLEKMIDWMAERLPEQHKFILPGGSKLSAFLHLARSICRRAERRVVSLGKINSNYVPDPIIWYLNRLSDFLFTLSKWVNYKRDVSETEWKSLL